MFKSADLCIAVSDNEAEEIRKRGVKCEVVRNGVDVDVFTYKKPRVKAKKLLFVGNFLYFPNVDAINFFYNEVFKFLPRDATLTIVGKKVSDINISDPRIEKIDFIPDILDAYRAADVMVAPIRLGGGTNFKILEAMACGVPVVALSDRLEGLDIVNRENIMAANDSREFRDALEELFSDENLRIKISKNARDLVEKKYSWKVIGGALDRVWKNL
jgi:glycosyltransferase involved in cell wall biosynthesis